MTNRRRQIREMEVLPVIPERDAATALVHEAAKQERRRVEIAAMKSLNGLIETSQRFDSQKSDYKGEANQYHFDNKGRIQLQGAMPTIFGLQKTKSDPVPLSEHALGQFLARVSPQYFGQGTNKTMRTDDWRVMSQSFPKPFAMVMNELLDKYAQRSGRETSALLVRTFKKEARAIFTSMYGAVNNTDMLNALKTIIEPSLEQMPDIRSVRSEVTADDLHVQIVFRNITAKEAGYDEGNAKGTYGTGISVRNNEIGKGGIKVSSMIWRSSCTNSITVHNESAIDMRHVGSPQALLTMLKAGMIQILKIVPKYANMFFEAEYQALPELSSIVAGMSKEYGWSEPFKDAVLIGTEGVSTLAGLINGVSFAAHSATETIMERADASELAGRLLVDSNSIFAAARRRVQVR